MFGSKWSVGNSTPESVIGYWAPHSSTIDFCEANYEYSTYVCEMWNALSSLWIMYVALFGLYNFPSCWIRKYPRFALAWLMAFLIGCGSVSLHSTLDRKFQALDELPMIYAVLTFVYVLFAQEEVNVSLAFCCVMIAVLATVLYLVFELYVVFFAIYGLITAFTFIYQVICYFNFPSFVHADASVSKYQAEYRNAGLQALAYFGSAMILWIWENLDCGRVELLHFHTYWHFGAALGIFWQVQATYMIYLAREGTEFHTTGGGFLGLLNVVHIK